MVELVTKKAATLQSLAHRPCHWNLFASPKESPFSRIATPLRQNEEKAVLVVRRDGDSWLFFAC